MIRAKQELQHYAESVATDLDDRAKTHLAKIIRNLNEVEAEALLALLFKVEEIGANDACRPSTEAEIQAALDFGKTAEQHLRH